MILIFIKNFFLGMNRVARRLLERGNLNFCDCKEGVYCKSYRATMALMCKFLELCLVSQTLGFSVGLSHFGVNERSQKGIVGKAYRLEPDLDVYILTDMGRERLSERPGSDIQFPALPLSLFDGIEMKKPVPK